MNAQNRKRDFILQMGIPAEPQENACVAQYSALQFQPRMVALVSISGILFQSPAIFFALAAGLLWSWRLPQWNPFNALYNVSFGRKKGAYSLAPAQPPRRFAERMAGTSALATAILLLLGWQLAAYVAEAILVAAVIAAVFASFCLGTVVYHAIHKSTPGHGDTERYAA